MVVYNQDRFRDITIDEIIEKIRESELYKIAMRHNESEIIFLNRINQTTTKTELWDGTPIKRFSEQELCILRTGLPDNPNQYRMVEDWRKYREGKAFIDVYQLSEDLIREEVVEIIGTSPSFRPRNTWHRHFYICYDILTPEGTYPMERIRVSIDKAVDSE